MLMCCLTKFFVELVKLKLDNHLSVGATTDKTKWKIQFTCSWTYLAVDSWFTRFLMQSLPLTCIYYL